MPPRPRGYNDPRENHLETKPEPICARCHARGQGCCLAPDGPAHMFGLTAGEIAAIAAASGLPPQEFVAADRATPDFLEFLAALNPVFPRTMPGGRRLRLRLTPANACVLLGPEGCRLPVAARPLYCRIYPFSLNPHGRLMVLANPQCLAQRDARSWREVLKRLDMDEAGVRELFARLEELAADHQAHPPRLAPPPEPA